MEADKARRLAWIAAVDASRDMTRRSAAGVVLDEGGVVLVAGGHPMPYLINAVSRLDSDVTAEDVMARAVSFFAARDRGFTVLGIKDQDEDLMAAAEAAGMTGASEGGPLMALDGPPASVDLPDGLRLERCDSVEQVAQLVEVCVDAYAVYNFPGGAIRAAHAPASILLADHVVAVIGYDEEGPVAAAEVLATHGVAYLQWVATKQRAFRRGAGRAVTQAATAAGFELGARMAALIASPMGAPLYRRLGWYDVGEVINRVAFAPLNRT